MNRDENEGSKIGVEGEGWINVCMCVCLCDKDTRYE